MPRYPLDPPLSRKSPIGEKDIRLEISDLALHQEEKGFFLPRGEGPLLAAGGPQDRLPESARENLYDFVLCALTLNFER